MSEKRLDHEELKYEFLVAGKNFFEWNAGKNTPNILLGLRENIATLNATISRASEESARLAAVLNRLTGWVVGISIVALLVSAVAVAVDIVQLCSR